MLLAFRRGLLEPYYAQGKQSLARESMVISMMNMEAEASAVAALEAHRNTALAPHLDPKKLNTYLSSSSHTVEYACQRFEYDNSPYKTAAEKLAGDADPLIKAFKEAQKRGIIEQFEQKVQQLRAQAVQEE